MSKSKLPSVTHLLQYPLEDLSVTLLTMVLSPSPKVHMWATGVQRVTCILPDKQKTKRFFFFFSKIDCFYRIYSAQNFFKNQEHTTEFNYPYLKFAHYKLKATDQWPPNIFQ